ncbi:MAG: hypothetical protein HFJ50_00665 [Clostridia bacterium]|nr:hypothetical protein [Clostridia bacterium]
MNGFASQEPNDLVKRLEIERGMPLNNNTRQALLSRVLGPIEKSILEIGIIDKEKSIELLKEFNRIISSIDAEGIISSEIMKRIVEFESRVQGEKEATTEEDYTVMNALLSRCKELIGNLDEKTLSGTEIEWKKAKDKLENIGVNCTLEQQRRILESLTDLRLAIIKTKIKVMPYISLESEIDESEVLELTNGVYREISNLLNSENQDKREYGNNIRIDILVDGKIDSRVLYNKMLWEKLIEAGNLVSKEARKKFASSSKKTEVPRNKSFSWRNDENI